MRVLSRIVGFLALFWLIGFFRFVGTIDRQESLETLPDMTTQTAKTGIVAVTGGGGARIEAAVFLLAEGVGERVLISGVAPGTRLADLKTITPDMDPTLYDCCVDLGAKARTTLENAMETHDWAASKEYSTLILVTTDYHMPRAMAELRRRLPDTQLLPWPVPSKAVPEEGWMRSPEAWRILAIEYSKFLVARARLAADSLA